MNKKDQITIISVLVILIIVMSIIGVRVLVTKIDGVYFFPQTLRIMFSIGLIVLYIILGKRLVDYLLKK